VCRYVGVVAVSGLHLRHYSSAEVELLPLCAVLSYMSGNYHNSVLASFCCKDNVKTGNIDSGLSGLKVVVIFSFFPVHFLTD